MSKLTRVSILLAGFFALDKGLAILRQVIIARQFGLSPELDAFNVANNLPDMLFALISGGALAMAFIPVLSEVLALKGQATSWQLFSRIANLAFLVTAGFAVLIALFAGPLVRWELGIAPGFQQPQQQLVITLMRFNLVATLIFSISGLVMAGLQANKHFLLPALAPLFYNLGQITGALILAPSKPVAFAGITLPAFSLGVHGLVAGVILGAILHLAIQIPGLLRFRFRWLPSLGLNNPDVRKVLRLLLPRLATMFTVQLIFIVRDNLASRLEAGSVTALTYGWMIMQVPETLIGTAIGTALLPTLSENFARKDQLVFQETLQRAIRVLLAVTLPVAVVLAAGIGPLISFAFGFGAGSTDLLLWVSRGYLAGLVGQCLLEVAARSFYAMQDAKTPFIASLLNVALYLVFGILLYKNLGAPGISLSDSIAFTLQAVFLLVVLNHHQKIGFHLGSTAIRSILASVTAGLVVLGVSYLLGSRLPPVVSGLVSMLAGGLAILPWIRSELRLLLHL